MPRAPRLLTVLAALVLAGAGCSSAASKPGSATTRGSGPVDVLYAGSLVNLMDRYVGPAFHTATGYSLTGFAGDSGSLANEIKSKVQVGDVFISASAAKDRLLQGEGNGSWVTWYATFASSPLVLAYNPHSRFAADLRTKPWYQVVTEPGFLLGRTDPATDPKGQLTVKALTDAAGTEHAPALRSIISDTSSVFPEATLVGRLQSGNLDAGFFYSVEATSAKLPAVPLSGVPASLRADYTVTILNGAPHEPAAVAFVRFLLSSQGAAALSQAGLTLTNPPVVTGTPPAPLEGVLPGG